VFYKNILEIFDLIFFLLSFWQKFDVLQENFGKSLTLFPILSLLENVDMFCRKILENFPFPHFQASGKIVYYYVSVFNFGEVIV